MFSISILKCGFNVASWLAPAHCWSWQWKGCCFPWGSLWRHSDWCEAHGYQQAVQ